VRRWARHFGGTSVIVTGGASGIGRALSGALVGAGAHVVLADLDGDAASRVASTLAGPGSAAGAELDVRDEVAFRSLVDEVCGRRGRLDHLFNNAGTSVGGPTHEMTVAHWDHVLDVSLRGVVHGTLAAYPRMVEQGSGHLVNTASAAGLVAPPFLAAYATAKHAVVGLSLGLRAEAALHGVRVTALCPGAVETPILDRPPADGLPPLRSPAVTPRQYLEVMRQKPLPAPAFAGRALRDVARNRPLSVAPAGVRALWYLHRISPALTDRAGAAIARRVDRALLHP
jgi:NAD(P)-dependent dehydrogenase (short-subunit alcohol dehydrogenase family)